MLLKDPVVGYHVWYNRDILVASILDDGSLSLIAQYFNEDKYYKLRKNVGRSLHKIPGSDLISYISKEDENSWEIRSLDPISGETKGIMGTLPDQEDICWLADGTILMGYEDSIYSYKPGKDVDWIERASLKEFNISKITRLAVSPNGQRIAIVGEGGQNAEADVKPADSGGNDASDTADVEQIIDQ